MSTTTAPKTTPTTTTKAECCTEPGCEFGLRNRYFFGKPLSPYSFQVEQRYMLERRRLLNRAIYGWGVVYGFAIKTKASDDSRKTTTSLHVGPGLALDRSGRELLQAEELSITVDDLIVIDDKGRYVDLKTAINAAKSLTRKSSNPDQGECWLLSAHYAEHDVGPIKINDACHCEHDEWDQTCETVRYSLQRISCDKCHCNPNCELDCKCENGKDGEPTKDAQSHNERRQADMPLERGGCRCLCEHITNLQIAQDDVQSLCEIEESCGHRIRIDLHSGVPLACIDLVGDECDRWAFGREVEACDPRRLVKRNDLLYDLVRGCDLTYIKDYGWKKWHRQTDPGDPRLPFQVPFSEFRDAFGPEEEDNEDHITRGFWIEFSRPVRRETVRQDCFVMTIISAETDDRWWETARVPIVGVATADDELIERATLVVSNRWWHDTIRKGSSSRFQGKATRVEIEVRGDFIVDCNDQTIDANAHGLSQGRTGNGTPGGTFLSTFLVEAAPESESERKYEVRSKGVS